MKRHLAGLICLLLVSGSALSLVGLSSPAAQAQDTDGVTHSFSPPVKTDFSWRPTNTIQKKGSLENYIENESENLRIENYDNYVEVLRDNDFSTDNYSRLIDNIPSDWIENNSDSFVSFRRPGKSVWVYDVEILENKIQSKYKSGLPKKIQIKWVISPNRVTETLWTKKAPGSPSMFNENYYYNGRDITALEWENLRDELSKIPVSVHAGSMDSVHSRTLWNLNASWNAVKPKNITTNIHLHKRHAGYALASGKLGSHSISWTVSSQTDWSSVTDTGLSENEDITSGSLEILAQAGNLNLPNDLGSTGLGGEYMRYVGSTDTSTPYKASAGFAPLASGYLTSVKINVESTNGSDYISSVPVRLAPGGCDTTYGEGTQVATWDPAWSTGWQTVSFSEDYYVEAGENYELELNNTATSGDWDWMRWVVDYGTSTLKTYFHKDGTSGGYAYARLEFSYSQAPSALWASTWHSYAEEQVIDNIVQTVNSVGGGLQVKVQTSNDGSTVDEDSGWISITSTGSVTKSIGTITGTYSRVKYDLTMGITPEVADFTVESYATNTAPNAPTNLSPSGRITTTSPTLSADVTDPDGDSMDVTFYDASDDSTIGTDTGVADGGTASVTWSPLTRGNSYSFYADATDPDGATSSNSSVQSFTVNSLPYASSLDVQGTDTHVVDHTPTMSWAFNDDDGDTQSNYEIEVWTGSGRTGTNKWDTGSVASSNTSDTYAGTALSDGSTYYMNVRVYDGYEWSSWTEHSFTMNEESTTSGVDVSGTNTNVVDHTPDISWNYTANDGDTQSQYEIEVGTSSSANDMWNPAPVSSSVTSDTYAGSSLTDGSTYYVRVRTYDGYEWSTWDSISFTMNSLPSASSLDVTGTDTHVTDHTPDLSWSYSDPEGDTQAQYDIQVGSTSGGSDMWDPAAVSSSLTSDTYAGSSLVDGSTYYFQVRVYDGYEWGSYTEHSFTMNSVPTVPTNPTDLSLRETDHSPDVSWGTSSDAEGDTITYWVETSADGSTYYLDWSGTTTSCTLDYYTFADGEDYWWKVRAGDSYENSSYTTADKFQFNQEPIAPENLIPSARQTTTSVTLEADVADPDGDAMTVFFYDNADDSQIDNQTGVASGSTTSVTWSGLTRGNTYSFYAKSEDNEFSPASSVQTFTVNSLPSASSLDVTGTDTHVTDHTPTMSWTFNDGDGDSQTKYEIHVGSTTGDNDMWDSGIISSSSTSDIYAGSSLQDGQTYYFQVKVYDGYEWDDQFVEHSFTMNSKPVNPTSWTDLGTHLTDHTPAVSWSGQSDAEGDTVTVVAYVGTTSTPTTQEDNSTTGTLNLGTTVTLTDGETYYYRLRSYDGYEWNNGYTTSDEFRMNSEPIIESVSYDNSLIDRKSDYSSSIAEATKLTITVSDAENRDDIENLELSIRNSLDGSEISNLKVIDNSVIDENTLNFIYTYDPSDSILDGELGGFDTYLLVEDIISESDNYGWSQDFTVDDGPTAIPNVENIVGHEVRIYKNGLTTVFGNSLSSSSVTLIDNNEGSKTPTVTGDNYEITYSVSTGGKVYAKMENGTLDGISSDNLTYPFPNFTPNVDSISINNSLIDRDIDRLGSNAIENGTITVQLSDEDNRTGDLEGSAQALLSIRDNSDTEELSSQDIISSKSVVDENTISVTYTYNPSDSIGVGLFDVKFRAVDNYGKENLNGYTEKGFELFLVDDIIENTAPAQIENLPGHKHRVTASFKRVSGNSLTLQNAWRVDNNEGEGTASVSGTDVEDNYKDTTDDGGGKVHFEADSSNLDGVTTQTTYPFPNLAPSIDSVTIDETLIDRDIDRVGSNAVDNGTITVQLSDEDNRTGDLEGSAQALLSIRDNSDSEVVSSSDIIGSKSVVDENTIEVTYTYDPSDAIGVGNFDTKFKGVDNYGKENLNGYTGLGYELFMVDDLENASPPTQDENIGSHRHRVSVTFQRVTGNTLTLVNAWRIDNNDGEAGAVISGTSVENTYGPTGEGKVYFEADSSKLDGYSDNLSYVFPNFAPEILSFSSVENLVDVRTNRLGYGTDNVNITIRVRDRDNRDDFDNLRITIYDNNLTFIDNLSLWSSKTIVNENTYDLTYNFNPDNSTDNYGFWIIGTEVHDNYLDNTRGTWMIENKDNLVVVDDYKVPITLTALGDRGLAYGAEVKISGDPSRWTGLSGSIDNVWVEMTAKGENALGAEDPYDQTYGIENQPGETVTVTVHVWDNLGSGLDGENSTTFVVNENGFFIIKLRYEDNYEWIPDPDGTEDSIENQDIYVVFHYENYEDQEFQMTDNQENFTVKYDANWVRMRFNKGSENQYSRAYIITKASENITAIGIKDKYLSDLSLYTLKLSEELTQSQLQTWGPPKGIIGIYKYHKGERFYIQKQYWSATNDASIWMKFGYDYEMYLKGATTQGMDYGAIVADTNYTKVVNPVAFGEIVETIYNEVFYDVISIKFYEDNHDDLVFDYQDNSGNTNWVSFNVYNENTGENVWYEKHTTNPNDFSTTWNGAKENIFYSVYWTISHENLGFDGIIRGAKLTFVGSKVEEKVDDFPGLGLTNKFNMPVAANLLLSFLLMVGVLVSFGPEGAGFGVILVGVLQSFFKVWGILDISWPVVALVFVLGGITLFTAERGRF